MSQPSNEQKLAVCVMALATHMEKLEARIEAQDESIKELADSLAGLANVCKKLNEGLQEIHPRW